MTSDDESPLRAVSRFGSSRFPDWCALVETRANVLVQGRQASLDQFLDSVRLVLREPVSIVQCGPAMTLHCAPTVVLENVDRLSGAEQHVLHAWAIDARNDHTQLIALSSVALYRLVKVNAFDRDLYYRLNTIFIQLERL